MFGGRLREREEGRDRDRGNRRRSLPTPRASEARSTNPGETSQIPVAATPLTATSWQSEINASLMLDDHNNNNDEDADAEG